MKKENGYLLTNGGRVLAIVAVDNDLEVAVENAYKGNPTTAINANVTQGSANTEDSYGNIKI